MRIGKARCNRFLILILAILFLSALLAGVLLNPPVAQAQVPTEEPEKESIRKTTIKVDYVSHEWWLVRWKNNEITCRFLIEHTGWPTAVEVEERCGRVKAQEWIKAAPCNAEEGGDVSQCSGAYVSFFQSYSGEREIEIELPLPYVWLSLTNCEQETPENACRSLPNLRFIGEELLANESIIRIQGMIDNVPFSCPSDVCDLPLWATGKNGVKMQFWADSSFGDSSEVYEALIRVQPWGDFTNPEGNTSDGQLWYVDVISSQWRGSTPASCAETWQALPDVGGPPPWLLTPKDSGALYTDVSFYYLAGMLIKTGQVDARFCPDNGLNRDYIANACGLQEAYSKVVEWQNSFNEEIMTVANETGIPAQLLKNIFSRESQFWPGIYSSYKEAGLGQMTEKGADTLLLWNTSFYQQFCPLILNKEHCNQGFAHLSGEEQDMLRGALVTKVNSTCPECPEGIDLSQANFSVRIFAEGLKANCEQVGMIIRNNTRKSPGELSSYEDLWRFTLVNYNAGPGCLNNAIQLVYRQYGYLTWENVAKRLEPACSGAIDYVEDLTIVADGIEPTPTSWVRFSTPNAAQLTAIAANATPTPTFSAPGFNPTATSGQGNVQPTATGEGYPYYAPYPTPEDPGYNAPGATPTPYNYP